MPSSQSAIPVLPSQNEQLDAQPPSSTFVRRKALSPREPQKNWSSPAPAHLEPLPLPGAPSPERPPSARSSLSRTSAARQVIDHLIQRGVDTFFGIPGGPICPLFEAIRLHESATLIDSRHESHAAFAACAYYRATGKPAAVVVTAGPGATNAVTGVASADSEAVPMLVISGDVAWSTHGGRLAQNSGPEGIHLERLFAPITRCQIRVSNARSAVGQCMTALKAATCAVRPGPALFILPIDHATQETPLISVPSPQVTHTLSPHRDSVRQVALWLAEAKRPLIVLGAGCHGHNDWVRQLVDVLDVPFITTPRAKGIISEDHPRSLRNGGMAASRWARAYTKEPIDVALVLGTDLDDTSVGPTPYVGKGGRLVHVDINPQVFNRNLPTQLAITADLRHFCNQLYQTVVTEGHFNERGRALTAEARSRPAHDVAHFNTDDAPQIRPHRAISDLQLSLPSSTRFVTDIGEHMLFALHYVTARREDSFHIQLNLGSMGSGIAGAIGLAIADPSRPVACICGDGGMQMSGMEILTAVKHRLPIIYAVFNDARYNMVHHGMKQIFGEAEPYDSPHVDFALWARSMGVPAETIQRPAQINRRLVERLMSGGGPALLDIHIDRETRLRAGGRVEALAHMSMLSSQNAPGGKA